MGDACLVCGHGELDHAAFLTAPLESCHFPGCSCTTFERADPKVEQATTAAPTDRYHVGGRENPLCGDPEHRHSGPCFMYARRPDSTTTTTPDEVERERIYAAAAKALLPWADDEDAGLLFEWHACNQCPSQGGPCACSGQPWPGEAVQAAINAALTDALERLEQVERAAREFLEATSSSADTVSWGDYAQREARLARLVGYIVPGIEQGGGS
jgi:hypothetical protein